MSGNKKDNIYSALNECKSTGSMTDHHCLTARAGGKTASGSGTTCCCLLLLSIFGFAGCQANQKVMHGNQEYILFADTPEPVVSATDPVVINPVAPETSEFQPVYDDNERLSQMVNDAQDLLMDNDAESAIEILTDAQTITGWTQSRFAPRLLFWLGHAYDQLNENIAAIAAYRQLVLRYPDSGSAKRAQKRLQQLSDDNGGY